jgi:anaerobic selenocysteine-containing dehydrogenase
MELLKRFEMDLLKRFMFTRRRFMQLSGLAGLVSATGIGIKKQDKLFTSSEARAAQPASGGQGATKITKSICHQCPGRCGIDVYTTDGRVHAIYGSLDHPISNGKLCPKGHLGAYILYDPDRFKGPMKRTNPNKGRNEDPKFVPISWDEALDTIAARLQNLRDNGESHRFYATTANPTASPSVTAAAGARPMPAFKSPSANCTGRLTSPLAIPRCAPTRARRSRSPLTATTPTALTTTATRITY